VGKELGGDGRNRRLMGEGMEGVGEGTQLGAGEGRRWGRERTSCD